jgi:hypothetical protein
MPQCRLHAYESVRHALRSGKRGRDATNEAMGRLPPYPSPEKFAHITLFLGNTLLDIFKRQLIATSVPLLCQKCGRKSAEVGKLSEVLEIVDNSMQ